MSQTPDIVIEALLAAPLRVEGAGGIVVRPFNLQTQLVLEKIGHRILSEVRPTLSSLENAELLYALAGDPEEVCNAAFAGGPEWQMEVLHFARQIPVDRFAACMAAAIRQINAAFAPAPHAEKKSPNPSLMPSSTASKDAASAETDGSSPSSMPSAPPTE